MRRPVRIGSLGASLNGWLPGLALFGFCILAYIPVFHGGFIWDDDRHVTHNPLLWEPGALKKIWFSLDLPQYYPMVFSVWRLQYSLWGLNPAGYHWVNVLLHATSAVLVWRILRRLGIPGAWFAAACFALHPVNVESVAWVSQLKNTLAMMLFLLSVLWYLRSEEKTGARVGLSDRPDRSDGTDAPKVGVYYALSLSAFIFGLMSKPAVAPLPFVLLLIAWWQRDRIQARDIIRVAPFFVAAIVLGVITYRMEQWRIGTGVVRDDGFLQRLAGAGWSVWFYLSKTLFPFHLIPIYPRWEISASRLLSYAPGILLLTALIACRRVNRPWAKAALFGMFYFIIMLGPVLGFMNIGFMNYSLAADHWQYFAIPGPLALVASWLYSRLSAALTRSVVFGVLLLAMGILTLRQSAIYENSEKLWTATVAADPLCWQAHSILADTLVKESGLYEQAIPEYEKALSLRPGFVNNENNLANVYRRLKQPHKAIEHLRKAVALEPRATSPHFNLGAMLHEQGDVDEAITQFEIGLTNAVLMDPHSESALADPTGVVQAHLVVGNILLYGKADPDKAIRHYRTALELKPDFAEAHFGLAEALERRSLPEEAIKEYQAVLSTRPDAVEARQNLASLLFKRQQPKEAITHLERALELRPDFARACDALAWILATCPEVSLRNGTKALVLAQRADSFTDGKNALVIRTLAAAHAETGQFNEALAAVRRAEQLAGEKGDQDLLAKLRKDAETYAASAPLRDAGYLGNGEDSK